MAAKSTSRIVIADLRGGRNGFDPPWAIKDTECVDAVNVDFYKTTFANKRGGMTNPTTTGATGTGTISSVFRHVPTTSEAAAELWKVDDGATPVINRLAGGTSWAAPTLKDSPTGNGYDFTACSINGKLILGYKSAQDRLHGYDPNAPGGAAVKRLGLAAMGVPSIANTGTGSYAATLRYYRTRATYQSSGVTLYRSEPSTAASFTPSGTGSAARVTQGSVPGEGETHWEVEASTDNSNFYRIATVVIGTTTYDDSAATTSYSSNPLSALTGVYTLWTSVKFVAADQNRLLGFGNFTSTNKQARIFISAVIGSSDIGDEERIDTSAVNSYIDLDENDSGIATGLAGPVFGAYFAFKDRQVWKLTPTGATSGPYRQDAITKSIGAVHHYAITRGEDAAGNPALYWMSHRGPYRWSINGLEYLGRGMEDYILGPTATINLAAAKSVARSVYYADKRQVWMAWATGSSDDCCQLAIYDVIGGGWSRVPTGDLLANLRCMAMFSNTLGASMSRDLKPYIGQTGAAGRLWKADSGTDDNGTNFQAYVDTKVYEPWGAGYQGSTGNVQLMAKAANGVTITSTTTLDFGFKTQTDSVSLAPAGSETRVIVKLTDSCMAGAGGGPDGGIRTVSWRFGDSSAVSNGWTLDRAVIPFDRTAPDTQ